MKRFLKVNLLKLVKLGIVVGMIVVIVFFLFPFLWLLLTSVKTDKLIFSTPPPLIFKPSFSAYCNLVGNVEFRKHMLNSLIVAFSSSAIALLLGTMAAFGYNQIKGKFSKISLIGLLTIRMVPYIIFLVPIYVIYSKLGILDTYLGLITTYQVFLLPFSIWMIWNFFEGLPKELSDASKVDGCSPVKTLFFIYIPLSIPILGIVFIFNFIFCWNEFIIALILSGNVTRTVPVFIASLVGDRRIEWAQIAAAGALLVLPAVVLTFFLAKYFVSGLTGGAVKE